MLHFVSTIVIPGVLWREFPSACLAKIEGERLTWLDNLPQFLFWDYCCAHHNDCGSHVAKSKVHLFCNHLTLLVTIPTLGCSFFFELMPCALILLRAACMPRRSQAEPFTQRMHPGSKMNCQRRHPIQVQMQLMQPRADNTVGQQLFGAELVVPALDHLFLSPIFKL